MILSANKKRVDVFSYSLTWPSMRIDKLRPLPYNMTLKGVREAVTLLNSKQATRIASTHHEQFFVI
jgi:hypothetical protein